MDFRERRTHSYEGGEARGILADPFQGCSRFVIIIDELGVHLEEVDLRPLVQEKSVSAYIHKDEPQRERER